MIVLQARADRSPSTRNESVAAQRLRHRQDTLLGIVMAGDRSTDHSLIEPQVLFCAAWSALAYDSLLNVGSLSPLSEILCESSGSLTFKCAQLASISSRAVLFFRYITFRGG